MSKKTLKQATPQGSSIPRKNNEVSMSGEQVMNFYKNEREKLKIIQNRNMSLNNLLNETLLTMDSLNEIKKTQKNEKILVPLGAGVFADATLIENEKVKISLGGNVMIDAQIEKALDDLGKRKEELEKDIEMTVKEENQTINQINSLGNIIQQARGAIKNQRSRK
ncbi:MAG: prefoldin subunit alpha [archaeon]|nr:prefoldin subunit alpha [archaeon]